MEVRSEGGGGLQQVIKCDKLPTAQVIPRTRLQVWFIRVCSSILIWTCLVQLVAVGELWQQPRRVLNLTNVSIHEKVQSPPPLVLPSECPYFGISSFSILNLNHFMQTRVICTWWCGVSEFPFIVRS